VATQLNDMSLGGSGFAAGYTPIRFAPLVSLTGPIQGATPTAAAPSAPQAPMIRPPMVDQGGGYEGMGPAFTGDAIGEASRMGSPAGRRAELANLANAAGFLASPFGAMTAYALTGQSPAQFFNVGDWRTAQGVPQGAEPQGIVPPGGVSRLFGGVRDFLFGPPQQSVSLGDMRAPAGAPNFGMNVAVFNDAYELAMSRGADDLAATNAASSAASLVAQGVDPITAVTIASQYAVGAAGPQLSERPGLSTNAYALPSGPQGMPGLSSNAFDLTAPIAAAPAQTFGIGGGGQIASTPLSGGESMGSYGEGSFTGGGWSPGDVAGAYSDSTGFE
jgi:hypothetical protein